MEGDFIKINEWLTPLSWIYGLAVGLRNALFNIGLLKSHAFHVPVISVGNITVGGTGKTPHVEYLIKLLQEKQRVAVLSRGYKRKSKGFVMGDAQASALTIGDEPFQMMKKFPKAIVAVDKNRVEGIRKLINQDSDIDVILLDDAFQHRYVKPGINILLVDYHRLIIYDKLLPAGRLREPLKGKDRADIVIITKCPKELKPMDYRVITKAMNLYRYQSLYFTTFNYEELQGIFNGRERRLEDIADDEHVLLLTGIASPRQLEHDLAPRVKHIVPLSFPDHHAFRRKDVEKINVTFHAMPSPKCIITTDKDAVRIRETSLLSEEVRQAIYTLPIHVTFMLGQEEQFNENIIGYVRKNSRNSILVKAKDDAKPQDAGSQAHGSGIIHFK